MKTTTKAGALVPAFKHAGQTLAGLCVFALLALFGSGVSHPLLALYPQPSDPGGGPSARMAASNGEILIGSMVAATNGVRIAASNGDIHIGSQVPGQAQARRGERRRSHAEHPRGSPPAALPAFSMEGAAAPTMGSAPDKDRGDARARTSPP